MLLCKTKLLQNFKVIILEYGYLDLWVLYFSRLMKSQQ